MPAFAQEYTLEDALKLTRDNYDRQGQEYRMISESVAKALWYAYIPQLNLQGQTTYQSIVPYMEIEMPESTQPGMPKMAAPEMPKIPKLQYQAYLEARQVIWDGGQVAAGARLARADGRVRQEEVALKLRDVEERVRGLYFGILMLDRQIELQRTLLNEYGRQKVRIQSSIEGGVATRNDLDQLRVEELGAEQHLSELEVSRGSLAEALLTYMGKDQEEADTLRLKEPELPSQPENALENRAEYRLLEGQRAINDAQWGKYKSTVTPTIGLFARVGYGRPGLNLFDPEPRDFFLGGVTVSWNIGNFYEWGQQKSQWKRRNTLIDLQREDMDRQLKALESKTQAEARKYAGLLEKDREIVRLRRDIRDRAKVQVEQGVLSRSDLMQRETELTSGEQLAEIHRLQHLQAMYNNVYLYR